MCDSCLNLVSDRRELNPSHTLGLFIALLARSQTSLIFQQYWQKKRDVSHATLCSLYPPLTSHSGQLSFVLKILRLLVKDCCWLFIDCCYEAKTYLDLLQTCSHSQIIKCSCLVSVSTFHMKCSTFFISITKFYKEKYTITVKIKIEAFFFFHMIPLEWNRFM